MNHKLDTDTQVFFYEQEFYVLSNFSAFTLEWKGIRFDTSEAAYHWEKFIDYPNLQEQIRQAPSAHAAFKIAERNSEFVRKDWTTMREGTMRRILWEKVNQHEYVKVKLLETGDRELIEDSWRDSFWGWGADQQGKNALGKLWMSIRHEVRAMEQHMDRLYGKPVTF